MYLAPAPRKAGRPNEAALRKRLAMLIEALRNPDDPALAAIDPASEFALGWNHAVATAARIVRES